VTMHVRLWPEFMPHHGSAWVAALRKTWQIMGCKEDGEERETREAKADGKMDERWRRGQCDPYTTNDRNEMAGEERVLPEEVVRRTTARSSE
jgi:hypothetical protein